MATKKLKVKKNKYDLGGLASYNRPTSFNSYFENIANPLAGYEEGVMKRAVEENASKNDGLMQGLDLAGHGLIDLGISVMAKAGDKQQDLSAYKNAKAGMGKGKQFDNSGFGHALGVGAKKFGGAASGLLHGLASFFADGGVAGEEENVEHVPIEAEGGEMIAMPWQDQAMPIEGASHENGGVDMTVPVGSKIYSKRVKDANGKSMAYRKERRDRELRKWEREVEKDKDNKIKRDTLEKVRRNNEIEEANDMAYMQLHKAKKQFSDYIKGVTKDYGKGGGLDLAAARQAIDQHNGQPMEAMSGERPQYALGANVQSQDLSSLEAKIDALNKLSFMIQDPVKKAEIMKSLADLNKMKLEFIKNNTLLVKQNSKPTPLSDPKKTGFGLFKSQANPNAKSPYPTYQEVIAGKSELLNKNPVTGESIKPEPKITLVFSQSPNKVPFPSLPAQQSIQDNNLRRPFYASKYVVGNNNNGVNSNYNANKIVGKSPTFDELTTTGSGAVGNNTLTNNTVDSVVSNQPVYQNVNRFGVYTSDANSVPPATPPPSTNGGNLLGNWEGVNLDFPQHGNGRGNLSKEQLGKDIAASDNLVREMNSYKSYPADPFNMSGGYSTKLTPEQLSMLSGDNIVARRFVDMMNAKVPAEVVDHYIPQGSVEAIKNGGGAFIPGLVQLNTGEIVPVDQNNVATVPAATTPGSTVPSATVPLVPTNTGKVGNTNVGTGVILQTPSVGNSSNNATPGVPIAQAPTTNYVKDGKIDYKSLTSDTVKWNSFARSIADSIYRNTNSIAANANLTDNDDVKVLKNDIMTAITIANRDNLTADKLKEKLVKMFSNKDVFKGQKYGGKNPLTDAVNIAMSNLTGTGAKQDNTKGTNTNTAVAGNPNANTNTKTVVTGNGAKQENTNNNKKLPDVASILKLDKDGKVTPKSLQEFNEAVQKSREDAEKQVKSLDENDTVKQGNTNEEGEDKDKVSALSLLGSMFDPSSGFQLAGIIHNMFKPKEAVKQNFDAKQRYKNYYRDYGKKSLLELDKMKDNLRTVMDQNMRDLEDKRVAQTYANNNSARDINVARALNLASLAQSMEASNRAYANYAGMNNQIHQSKASMLSDIDNRIMGEDKNVQMMNNQLIDSFFSNKASADMNFGTGLQNIGKLFENKQFINELKKMYLERSKSNNKSKSKSTGNNNNRGTTIFEKLKAKGAVPNVTGKARSKKKSKKYYV